MGGGIGGGSCCSIESFTHQVMGHQVPIAIALSVVKVDEEGGFEGDDRVGWHSRMMIIDHHIDHCFIIVVTVAVVIVVVIIMVIIAC